MNAEIAMPLVSILRFSPTNHGVFSSSIISESGERGIKILDFCLCFFVSAAVTI